MRRQPFAAFYSLESVRNVLQAGLARIDPHLDLVQAVAESTIDDLLGALVSVLDERRLHGVSLTTLLKVLHRKRPQRSTPTTLPEPSAQASSLKLRRSCV